MLNALDIFLTAYNPSDLPGGSLDALGFDRGYMFLADSILPGMTNVASRPRYISALCAGISLANIETTDTPYRQREKRRESALRFERLWALANVLASRNMEVSASGIRGITYVNAEIARLDESGATWASAKYKLLSRQQQYGAFGIYGAVAEGMRFLDRRSLFLTPDAGQRLAEAFIAETNLPDAIRKAVQSNQDNADVPMEALAAWGERAHVDGTPGRDEACIIREALHREPTRSRTVALLDEFPWAKSDGEDGESELRRFRRISDQLDGRGSDLDLRASFRAIVMYEESYQLLMLVFERILFLCRTAPSGAAALESIVRDEFLEAVPDTLSNAAKRLAESIEEIRETRPTLGFERIADIYHFILSSSRCDNQTALVRTVLSRHTNVQHGKFDGGRRKMPWIEEKNNSLSLTMTRSGGRQFEVTRPEEIRPHFYRTDSAEIFHRQGGSE